MKILFFEWNSYGNIDIKEAFQQLGHEVVSVEYDSKWVFHDEKQEKILISHIEDVGANIVFSFNYYVPVAYACYESRIPYVSWVYDSPVVSLYSCSVILDTNCIFVFDSAQYEEFAKNNITTVHYLPLAANTDRLNKMINDTSSYAKYKNSRWNNTGDISFVGSMYTEKHCFYNRLVSIDDYSRGYLEGIIETQKQLLGYNFVQEMLDNNVIDAMYKDIGLEPEADSVATMQFLYGEYVINREITARERYEYITLIARNNLVDLYTKDSNLKILGVNNHGPVDYYDCAPYVYNSSKINLNISLRSIHNGIPLRAFDIMGAGGFLLTNYQKDFADCYIDGEDFVSFSSKEDMLDKIEYYLSHDKERIEIANNGLARTKENHTYLERVGVMLDFI